MDRDQVVPCTRGSRPDARAHSDAHEINISLGGELVTEKISATGRRVRTVGRDGNICFTPAGQPISASWNGVIDNMGILLDPKFVQKTASENNLGRGFDF